MKRVKAAAVLVFIGILAFLGVRGDGGRPGSIMMSGNFEIDEIMLSFRVPGQIVERPVNEGQTLASGTLIARLDSEEFRLAVARAAATLESDRAALAELENGSRAEEKAQALAQLQQACLMLQQLENGARPQEKDSARAAMRQAEAALAKQKALLEESVRDEKRFSALFAENAISEKDYQAARTRADSARAALRETQARLESARQALSLTDAGPRNEEIARARASVQVASAAADLVLAGPRSERILREKARVAASEAALQQAELAMQYSSLLAPADGTILTVAAEPGEYMRTGQTVVTMGNLDRVFLRAYVNEKRLGQIKLGQTVKVMTDSFPGETFIGRIVFISDEAEFTPKSVQTHEERVKLVYRIKIAVDNSDRRFKPGMPADALLEL